MLDGVWAARENPLEAQLVAKLVDRDCAARCGRTDGKLYADDAAFFRDGVFVVSPHRAQIRAIRRELRRQRMWQSPPLVDTVDKMQGQEADAVIVSYGVSDPEFAAEEAEFIYGLNRLNVAITRARSKCIVCLPRPLLDAPPQVLDLPEAARGLAFMRALVESVADCGDQLSFELDDGARAALYRARSAAAGRRRQRAERRQRPSRRRRTCRREEPPARTTLGTQARPAAVHRGQARGGARRTARRSPTLAMPVGTESQPTWRPPRCARSGHTGAAGGRRRPASAGSPAAASRPAEAGPAAPATPPAERGDARVPPAESEPNGEFGRGGRRSPRCNRADDHRVAARAEPDSDPPAPHFADESSPARLAACPTATWTRSWTV